MRQRFFIVDRRTGEQVDQNVYPRIEWAWQQITEWQNRHDRGERPDVTRDMLLNMVPVEAR